MDTILSYIILGIIIYCIYNHKHKIKLKEEYEIEKKQKEKEEIQVKRQQHVLEQKMLFKKTLESMNNVSVEIKKDITYRKKFLRDMPEYKFSQITKSSLKNLFKDFVVIDVETTGLSAKDDEIIEISVVKFKNYTPIEYMSTLVRPQEYIREEITKINNITNEMVKDSPSISQVVDSFSDFIKGFNIVGYNLEFDLKFLYANNLDLFSEKRKFFDALELAKKVINTDCINDYKLTTVCNFCDLQRDDEHKALSDALATGIIFRDFSIEKTENYELRETNTFINEENLQ